MSDTQEQNGGPMGEEWITVAAFEAHAQALLAKSVLDSAGIECWLRDEHLGRLTGSHSFVIGGIKLQVRPKDLEAALTALQPGNHESPLGPEFQDEPARCPRCGATVVSFRPAVSFKGLRAVTARAGTCQACGHTWTEL